MALGTAILSETLRFQSQIPLSLCCLPAGSQTASHLQWPKYWPKREVQSLQGEKLPWTAQLGEKEFKFKHGCQEQLWSTQWRPIIYWLYPWIKTVFYYNRVAFTSSWFMTFIVDTEKDKRLKWSDLWKISYMKKDEKD